MGPFSKAVSSCKLFLKIKKCTYICNCHAHMFSQPISISPFWEWRAFCRTISTCWSWNKWYNLNVLLVGGGNDPITIPKICPILWFQPNFQICSRYIGNFFSWFNRLKNANNSILSCEPSMLRNGHCPWLSNWSFMLSGNLPRLTQSLHVQQISCTVKLLMKDVFC